jgi:hypothetical protein
VKAFKAAQKIASAEKAAGNRKVDTVTLADVNAALDSTGLKVKGPRGRGPEAGTGQANNKSTGKGGQKRKTAQAPSHEVDTSGGIATGAAIEATLSDLGTIERWAVGPDVFGPTSLPNVRNLLVKFNQLVQDHGSQNVEAAISKLRAANEAKQTAKQTAKQLRDELQLPPKIAQAIAQDMHETAAAMKGKQLPAKVTTK